MGFHVISATIRPRLGMKSHLFRTGLLILLSTPSVMAETANIESPQALILNLSSNNHMTRATAIQTLDLGWPAGRQSALTLLSDKSRIANTRADNLLTLSGIFVLIGRKKDPELYSIAMEYFKNPDVRVRQDLIELAGHFNDSRANQIFTQGLDDPDSGVRTMSVRRLYRTMGDGFRATYFQLAESADIARRAPAVEVLAYFQEKGVRGKALGMLTLMTDPARRSACASLGYIGTRFDKDAMKQADCSMLDLMQNDYENMSESGKIEFIDRTLRKGGHTEEVWARRELVRGYYLNKKLLIEYADRTAADPTHPASNMLKDLISHIEK